MWNRHDDRRFARSRPIRKGMYSRASIFGGSYSSPDVPAGAESPTALGTASSLMLNLPGQPASLVGIENSAGIQASSNIGPYGLVSLYGVGLGPANALGEWIAHEFAQRRTGALQ